MLDAMWLPVAFLLYTSRCWHRLQRKCMRLTSYFSGRASRINTNNKKNGMELDEEFTMQKCFFHGGRCDCCVSRSRVFCPPVMTFPRWLAGYFEFLFRKFTCARWADKWNINKLPSTVFSETCFLFINYFRIRATFDHTCPAVYLA